MRIGIVNDLPMAVEAQRRALLETNGAHQIAWVARDGAEAVRLCAKDRPELVLMDLIMPVMDGVEATRQIMANSPCAILLVTADPRTHVGKVFEAMGMGALDVVASPKLGNSGPLPILAKIETLGRLVNANARLKLNGATRSASERLVVIGASAGGPAAVAAVLAGLPADFASAIVVVQHVDANFAPGLAEWLDQQTPLRVCLAKTNDVPTRGRVLVAGTNDHLVFHGATLAYTPHPADYAYRPSVDVFFESAARAWRGELLGVLLTGMGRDGADGLKRLRDSGRHTIAQDEKTSAIYGMPKHAAAIGAAAEILPLDKIGPALQKFSRSAA